MSVGLVTLVTQVTLLRSYYQFYRAECITILGFFIHQCLPVIEQRCSCTLHTTNVFFLRHRKCIFNAPVPTRFDDIGVFLLFRYHKYILMHQYLPGFIHQVYSCILDTYICYICRECTFDAPVPRFDTPGVSLYFRYQKCKNMFKTRCMVI